MLKRFAPSCALALGVLAFSGSAHADVLNQRDSINGTQTDILDAPNPGNVRTVTIVENELIQDLSVTIEGLQHTFAGDLVATIRRVAADGSTIASATIFDRIGLVGSEIEGDNANFDGNYTFTSSGPGTASIFSAAADSADTDFVIPGSTGIGGSIVYGAVAAGGTPVSFASAFAGLTTAGVYEIEITDASDNDNVGSLTGVTLNFQSTAIAAVPEPGTFGMLAFVSLSGVLMVRRRTPKHGSAKTSPV